MSVVGNGERLGLILKGRHRENGSKNLFLEHAHLVLPFQDRRLVVVSPF